MPSINGIQSAPPAFLRPQEISGGGYERNKGAQGAGPAVDTYSGSSGAWRNRATAAVGPSACRCGSCPACAAQAYALQGQRLNGEERADKGSGLVQEQGGTGQEQGGATASGSKGVDGEVLSQQEQAQLAELKKVDRAVRAHEQAHMAAAGSLVTRGVSLSYEKGADGNRYAVAGEVSIDTSRETEPADTIAKMRNVRAAALAPVDPSPQDRKVAAAAMVTMTDAMNELQLARSAAEGGGGVVGQAAEKLAGRDTDDNTTSANEGAVESGVGEVV